MIASHYAEPVERRIATASSLLDGPSTDAHVIGQVEPGEAFQLLDDTLGWAWGYAGKDRRVGYVESGALAR